MDIASWKRLRELSEKCADLPSAQRLLWLQNQGLDARTCEQVLALVDPKSDSTEAHTDPARRIAERIMTPAIDELPGSGSRIGPWRLLEPIGEGGMGSVYRAERVDGGFEQEAAVKRMRAGLDQRVYLQRFESERQILARLQHPHIASLLDGGCTENGTPYLALEFVRGQTIAAYCDGQRLDLPQRLRLFLSVCAAVAYAHRHLIVHRDIKPSNVMVDADGQVKLLDFGVAKLLNEAGDGPINHTLNAPLTPAYASPEQLRGQPASTQTDVYALGLLLFELLTGVLPQRARSSRSADAIAEVLTTEAMAPSAALHRLTADDAQRAQIAAARATVPQDLQRQLRGDLDAILLKALRSEADDRYSSVDAFVADIDAYLGQRPVSARRGSRRYRLGRYIARNRIAVGLISLLLLSMLVGIAATNWKSIEAQRQALQATQMRDFVIDIFRRADPTNRAGAQTSARDLLDEGLARMDRSTLTDAASKAQIRTIMADAYLSLGATNVGHQLAVQALAEVETLGLGGESEASAVLLLARAENERGERQQAIRLLERAEPMIDASVPSENLARLYYERGRLQLSMGELEQATRNMERAVAVYTQMHGRLSDPALNASRVLAWIYDEAERYADINTLLAPLIAATEAGEQANPLYLADLLDAQANAASFQGQWQQAIDYRVRATQVTADTYGERHRYTGTRWNNLAFSYLKADQLQQAYEAMDKALTILRQGSPEGSHIIGSTASNFARISMLVGRHVQAETLIQEAIAIRLEKSTPVDVAYSTQIASSVARAQGDLSLARQRADRAEVLYAALERKPVALQQRLLLERAELNLLSGMVGNCQSSAQAVDLLSNGAVSANPAQRAYADFVHASCLARRDSELDAATLTDRYQIARDLQPPESARRAWLQQYFELAGGLDSSR